MTENRAATVYDSTDDLPVLRDLINNHAERIMVWVGRRTTGTYIDIEQFGARAMLSGGSDGRCIVETARYDETRRYLYIHPETEPAA